MGVEYPVGARTVIAHVVSGTKLWLGLNTFVSSPITMPTGIGG